MERRTEESFIEFAAGARSRLRATAYLLCGDWHLASDFVQDGLVRVYVAWPRLVRKGGEHAYARKAVISAVLDAKRKRSSTELPSADLSRAERPETGAALDLAGDVTTRRALLQALAQLPPRQRACVVLRYFEDLSVADTAVALGCSEGTVKSQTARGLDTLRATFDQVPGHELVVGERSR